MLYRALIQLATLATKRSRENTTQSENYEARNTCHTDSSIQTRTIMAKID